MPILTSQSVDVDAIESYIEADSNNGPDVDFWVDYDNGSDVTGDGRKDNPYGTLEHAVQQSYLAVGDTKQKNIHLIAENTSVFVDTIVLPCPKYRFIGYPRILNTQVSVRANAGPAMVACGYTQAGWGAFVAAGGLDYTLSDTEISLTMPDSRDYEYNEEMYSSITQRLSSAYFYFENIRFIGSAGNPGFIAMAPSRSNNNAIGYIVWISQFGFKNCDLRNGTFDRVSPGGIFKNVGNVLFDNTRFTCGIVLDNSVNVRFLNMPLYSLYQDGAPRVYVRDVVPTNLLEEGRSYYLDSGSFAPYDVNSVFDHIDAQTLPFRMIVDSDKPEGAFAKYSRVASSHLSFSCDLVLIGSAVLGTDDSKLPRLTLAGEIGENFIMRDSSSCNIRSLSVKNLVLNTTGDAKFAGP